MNEEGLSCWECPRQAHQIVPRAQEAVQGVIFKGQIKYLSWTICPRQRRACFSASWGPDSIRHGFHTCSLKTGNILQRSFAVIHVRDWLLISTRLTFSFMIFR